MDTKTLILTSIEICGGTLVIVAPLTRPYRSETPTWIRLFTFLGGLLVLCAVPFAFYVHGLRATHDLAYGRLAPLLQAVRFAAIALLSPSLVNFIYVRISKSRSA